MPSGFIVAAMLLFAGALSKSFRNLGFSTSQVILEPALVAP